MKAMIAKVPHPIPYQGSKRALAPVILDYFPPDAERLLEPFAGSAAVTIAALQAKRISHAVLNDINQPLITLWQEIVHNPQRLADHYRYLWHAQQGRERRFYDLVRLRFNQTHRPYYLLYLLARCVKASIRYNANGEFNQSPDNRRKGRHPDAMAADIDRASALMRDKAEFFSGDYAVMLQQAAPADLVYLDPPYQGVCAARDPRYLQSVTFERLTEQLALLNTRHISYILSYDGRTGAKAYGQPLPASLNLTAIEIHVGRSSQSTLLGRSEDTYEALYLSPALTDRLARLKPLTVPRAAQLSLFEDSLWGN